jgi:N-acyl-D-amino-acid deacylase
VHVPAQGQAAGEVRLALDTRVAIELGLRRIAQGAANYPKNRQCFSCHHQAMPILALTAARRRGFAVEPEQIREQVEFSLKTFAPRREQVAKGQGIGGASTTVGYALVALEAAGHPPDETTTAMVRFLLARQRPDGSWASSANRPPTEASPFTTTAVALRGLIAYGPAEDETADAAVKLRAEVAAAVAQGRAWLLRSRPVTTEDQVFRIFGLLAVGADEDVIRAAREQLLAEQQADGGWAQVAGMASDAYATGTALVALRAAGLSARHPAYRKSVQYLLRTQHGDGSWFVETRSRPIQTFFDNGDPGGTSQFLSFVATNWAVLALLETCGPAAD